MAIAVVAGLSLFAGGAEACISCNYVPEVVNTPVGPPTKAKPHRVAKPKQAPAKQYGARPAQKRVAKRPPVNKDVKDSKTPDATADTTNEAAATSKPDADAGKTTPVDRQADTDAGTDTSTAALNDPNAATADQKDGEQKGEDGRVCKKFSAAIGTVVTVPCN
jgi:hypothetical protein